MVLLGLPEKDKGVARAVIEIKDATLIEREYGCNVCEDNPDPTEVVLNIGRDRASTAVRLCVDHFLQLRDEVEDVYGWDVFRATW